MLARDHKPDAGLPQTAWQIELVEWSSASARLTALRLAVFVEEQGVPRDLDLDGLDADCRHVVVWSAGGAAVGTARLHRSGSEGKIGRMAVLKPWRGRGLGKAMLRLLLDHAKEQGLTKVTLAAQTAAAGFYAGAGFEATGPVFDDAGIPHRLMTLALSPSRRGGSPGGRR